MVPDGDSRSQGPDRPASGTARRLPVFQRAGETIYVGKARTLRDRVRSYLGAQGLSPRPTRCSTRSFGSKSSSPIRSSRRWRSRTTSSRRGTPRYNILLRDDKNYPYLQLTTGERVSARAGGAAGRARRALLRRPVPSGALARRTMALTHRLFGIRSCNEVITGKRGAAVPRVRHQALHCAVRGRRSARRSSTSRPCKIRGCSWRAAPRSSPRDLRSRMQDASRAPNGSKRRRSFATRMLTVETLAERHQKMATRRIWARETCLV